ncbi:MAG TPA: ABC transporter permease [Candidatus Limnocylindrales bacterium]|nr:ABC transporter permease [Candidatus Limnocylindrales bacterium]
MTWWWRLWHRQKMEQQLEKELRFHLERHAAELTGRGMELAEARRQAALAIGGAEQVKEECREARGTRWVDDLLQDTRYALRMLRKNPGFTAVALLTIALGIGATTVMFTLVNGVLLKPLPYTEPGRLVMVQEKTDWSTQYGNLWAFAYPNYLDCKRESHTLDMAAWRYNGGTVSTKGGAEYVDGFEISADLFSVLGVPIFRGRTFLPEEDRLGGAPVAIISYGLWQRLFAGSSAALGSPLSLDGKSYTVVGVAPPDFRLNQDPSDVFTVLGQDSSPSLQRRDRHPGIQVIARLRDRTTFSQAQSELTLIGRQLASQYPASNKGRSFPAEQLRPDVGDAGTTLWLLLGAVSLVLLIACVNVASLLLARAVSRERELAMRAALGASKGRLVRQCLTESAVLGISGGALGVLCANVGLRPFVRFWPGSLPRAGEVHLDWRVLVFALGVSLLSGLLFGLAPALRAPSRELEKTLRAGTRTTTGSSRRLHGLFVISEVGLAVVLLVAAGMLGRTVLRLSALKPGVNVQNVLVTRMALSPAVLANTARTRATWQEVLDSARRVPGVESAAVVDTVPMRDGNNQAAYWPTSAFPPTNEMPLALATSVTPDHLRVMGIQLVKGRFFTDEDRMGSEHVVVIDDVLAESAFHGEDPVGKTLWLSGNSSPFSSGSDAPDPAHVIGVVGHVRYWGLARDDQAQVRAEFYYPFAQVPDPLVRRWSELMSLAVRTSVAPLSVVQVLRHEVRGATADQVLYEVRTMEQLESASLAQQRFLLLLFGIFAGLALLLACTGIYGVLAYLTGQRVPEIGVRMALGATRGEVMRMVLRQSLRMVAGGVGAGLIVALAAGRLLMHMVDGMQPLDFATFAIVVLLLIASALVASFVPARRASRIDPMKALRQE